MVLYFKNTKAHSRKKGPDLWLLEVGVGVGGGGMR